MIKRKRHKPKWLLYHARRLRKKLQSQTLERAKRSEKQRGIKNRIKKFLGVNHHD